MAARKTTKEFIRDACKVHENKYDYSKVVYLNNKTNIDIICKKHGLFSQRPNDHLNGRGCYKCGRERAIEKIKSTTEDFVKRSKKVHGDRYDYSQSIYTKASDMIQITCYVHGVFKQRATDHISGGGCQLCGIEASAILNRDTIEDFVKKSREIHGYKYNYNQVKYINSRTPVNILCFEHGVFKQKPNSHISGKGCPKCNESSGERLVRKYLDDNKIAYEKEYRIHYEKSYGKLDFWLNEKHEAIEYHGRQHYMPVSFGSKKKNAAINNFLYNIERDKIKKKWCRDNKIKLHVIPFWEKERIDSILDCVFNNENPKIKRKPKWVIDKSKAVKVMAC